jgi:hypothetical protein
MPDARDEGALRRRTAGWAGPSYPVAEKVCSTHTKLFLHIDKINGAGYEANFILFL